MIEITIITLMILIPLTGFLYNRKSKHKKYYEIIWKKSSSLKPRNVLGLRAESKLGFNEYYYPRKDEDEHIRKKIEKDENVLIVGSPLAGKTRAIYQALISLSKPHDVIIPRFVDINTEDFVIPIRIGSWRKNILVLDDLDKFTENQNYMHLLHELLKRNTLIIACCRSGPEFERLRKKMGTDISSIFGEPIDMPKISREEGDKVAEQIGTSLPHTFDGNIGSIFLPLDTMRDRFRDCSEVNKCILRAIKRLYYAGIYREREIFSLVRIKKVCKKIEDIEMKSYDWKESLSKLENNGFIEIMKKDHVWAEEAYLKYVIKDDFSPLDNLNEMMNIFYNDAEALVNIGNRAYDIGLIDIQKTEYMKLAIKAYEKALEFYTLKEFPEDYAKTQNNLGAAYRNLADVENKAGNCSRAIGAYEEALKVRTLERFPMQYAMTQNNLGNAYRTLAEVQDKAENCKMAIEAFEEALKVYTLERFPMQYATTQNNLGNAYLTLAEVEDKADNCSMAIKAYEEALKIYTLERFPMQYAITQNNLGIAYGTLAEVEDKEDNCKKAIKACEEALKVRTLERFPMDYAMTQNNLGIAYRILSEMENKAENCNMAIEAYEEALKVYTLERFPMDYAMTQNNLGAAYKTLAEAEEKAENCEKALKAYKEALKVFTKKDLPQLHNLVQSNIRMLIAFCEGE